MRAIVLAALTFLGILTTSASSSTKPVYPITNPIYNDTAFPKNQITVTAFKHKLPDVIRIKGGTLPLDGSVRAIAIQIELAITDSLSFVANKDGYVEFDPDNRIFGDEDGFADLAAGLKWAFYQGDDIALAARGTFEFTNGQEKVFSGNGDGNFSPSLIMTMTRDSFQVNAVAGGTIPYDKDEESTMGFLSISTAWKATERFSPLLELNWFRVLATGDAKADFGDRQLNTTVPALVTFEGPDFFNLGARNADDHRDFVTVAVGARCEISDHLNFGFAYEWPITDEENSLMEDRFSLNLAINF